MSAKGLEDWERINKAIGKFLKLGFMWKPGRERSLLEEYGKDISEKVDEIYSFAVSYGVNWQEETMQDVLAKLGEALKKKYEKLDEEALTILKRCFSYNWK